ncbi:Fructosamine kinase [Sodalis glossinidius str. 'morsitans']|uniref:Fructosamine kinase n=2 Tax=Sodalis glossinidius (strain morsitans) TaxID=343509 RepID=A0A193QJV0_SODGM|nr:Fructosamine kinase [Sodalis glossinidius str. 'morsitans']
MTMWHAISTLLAETLDENTIVERRELPGGELHAAWYVRYGAHHIFVKSDAHELLQKFTDEADQLALLARSNTVRVPQVYGVGSGRESSFLLLEYLPPRPFDAHGAWRFGQQMARLHQWSEQPQFGLDFDNDLSTLPQPNAWQRRWSRFFCRTAHRLAIAVGGGKRAGVW